MIIIDAHGFGTYPTAAAVGATLSAVAQHMQIGIGLLFWLRVKGEMPSPVCSPELRQFFRVFVRSGGLSILYPEIRHERPKGCFGQAGAALASGLVISGADGVDQVWVDRLEEKYRPQMARGVMLFVVRDDDPTEQAINDEPASAKVLPFGPRALRSVRPSDVN